VAYVRTVWTGSGATAVQIVHGSRRGARDIEHLGSAHDVQAVEALKAVARQRLAGGQGELELGLAAEAVAVGGSGPLQIVSSRMEPLWEALCAGYDQLGLDEATGGDEVFRQLLLARIIEPTSKQDSLRVLTEAGIDAVSYATLKRRLQGYADDAWRHKLAAACAVHAGFGPASLVLRVRAGLAGALRRVHVVLRDRHRGRVSRAGVLQGTPAGAADHDRAAHRRLGLPVAGGGLRGQ
jgi:hypothetical protein